MNSMSLADRACAHLAQPNASNFALLHRLRKSLDGGLNRYSRVDTRHLKDVHRLGAGINGQDNVTERSDSLQISAITKLGEGQSCVNRFERISQGILTQGNLVLDQTLNAATPGR